MNRNISYSSLLEKAIIILLIIAFLLFILYPIVGLFIRSLTEGGEWSLYYYKDLFKDENLELIRNSVFVASLSSICATILALSIGLYAHFKGAKIRNYIYRGLMISMISPPFISSLGLLTLFGRRGLISYGLLGLTLNPYGWHGIVLLQSLGGIPLSAMFIMAGLNQIDSRLILASRDLGANTWQTLKNVILPSLIPTILSVLFLRFTMNISDFTTPIIIGGRFNVLATEAYLRVYAQANLNGAAAMTVLLLPPALMAFFFYNKNLQKTNTLSDRSKILDVESLNFKLPKLINFISATITVIFFIIMVVQYGNIFIQAISRNVSGKLVFTTDHLHFFQTRHFDALLRTIYMALIAGLLSTIFGLLLSYYNRMRRIPGMKSIEFIGSLPYIIPGIFFGLAYIVAFHNGPIKMTGTLLILIINCTFRHVSVGTKAANAAFENIDKKLEWASYDLGASKLQSLCTLIFPMLRPTFLTSFINAFTASMTTVGPLMLLISPKNLIISVLMFSEVSNGRYGQAAVMGGDLAPRVASKIHTGLTADCTSLDIDPESNLLLMTRPAFGGNIMATIVCRNYKPQMATVRPGVMKLIEKDSYEKGEVVNFKVDFVPEDMNVEILEVTKEEKKHVDITEAKILVSGGRGVGGSEGFDPLKELADALGGEVASSRAGVDSGWIGKERQVGQTGKTVRPNLYIACGISGAIQHMAGMEESDFILAINKDESAPMMDNADLGIVGDVKVIIPKLTEAIKKFKETKIVD